MPVPKSYDDISKRYKLQDFIVSLGSKNTMSVADIDIESSGQHLRRPFVVFYDNADSQFTSNKAFQEVHPTVKLGN